jgi:transmembrane sensor
MNLKPTTIDPHAEEQAALWAARLDGSVLSAADRTALDAWLAAKPGHRALLSQYSQFSADLEECLPILVESGAVEMPVPAAPTRHFGLKAWATGIAAAAVLAVSVWWMQPKTQFQEVVTTVSQRQTVTLADGTRVELNANTTLHVQLTRHERRVQLAGGEAFFSVTKDKSRPFIVETPGGLVRVTGTSFDVRSDSTATAKFVVTVVEGTVQVRPGESARESDSPVMLGAGDRLTLENAGVSVQAMDPAHLTDALAWRKGQIVFINVRLQDALAQFARYHGRTFSTTPQAAEQRLGGRFSLDDADGFLAAIQEILPVRVSHGPKDDTLVEMSPPR